MGTVIGVLLAAVGGYALLVMGLPNLFGPNKWMGVLLILLGGVTLVVGVVFAGLDDKFSWMKPGKKNHWSPARLLFVLCSLGSIGAMVLALLQIFSHTIESIFMLILSFIGAVILGFIGAGMDLDF